MNSYKQWKQLNESSMPFGSRALVISTPPTIGGLQSQIPLISEKKKMDGKVVADELGDDEDEGHKCSCSDKGDKHDDHDDDHDDEKLSFSKKAKMKKKMKKMDDEVPEEEDHDDHDEDHEEEDHHDDDHEDEDEDDDHDDDHDDEEEEGEEGGEEDLSDDREAEKYGFMKDKGKKMSKKDKKRWKKKKMEEQFWQDLGTYATPKHSGGSEKEFYQSLQRQYGNPTEKHSGGLFGNGVNEDLLLTPDQEALIDAMPRPGEPGFAPRGRMNTFGSSEQPELASLPYGESVDNDEAADFEVLKKYFSESVARELIEKRRS